MVLLSGFEPPTTDYDHIFQEYPFNANKSQNERHPLKASPQADYRLIYYSPAFLFVAIICLHSAYMKGVAMASGKTSRLSGLQDSSVRGQAANYLLDGKTVGFGLRVTAADSKSYIFRNAATRNTLRQTIGSPDTGPGNAVAQRQGKPGASRVSPWRREEAQRLKALTDQGIDPANCPRAREAKAAKKAAQASAHLEAEHRKHLTMRALLEAYTRLLATRERPRARHRREAPSSATFSRMSLLPALPQTK